MVSNATLSGLLAAVLLTTGAIYVANRYGSYAKAAPHPRLLRQDIDTFDGFQFRRGVLDIACSRREDGEWEIERPFAARADRGAVRAFLDAVSTAPILEHLTTDILRRRGTTPEQIHIVAASPRLLLRRHDGATVEMAFGTNTVEGRLYVETLGSTSGRVLHAVDGALFRVLRNASASTFRDRSLLPYPESQLFRLEIHNGPSILSMERDDTGWLLRQPIEARADAALVGRLLRSLFLTKVQFDVDTSSLADAKAEQAARHCTPEDAVATARFWFSSPTTAAPFRYSQILFGDHEGRRVYLWSTEENFLATTDADILTWLSTSAEQIRDRRLFRDRHAEDAVSLRVSPVPGSALVFLRDPETRRWSLDQPASLPARSSDVEAFLGSILALEDSGVLPGDEPPPAATLSIAMEFHDATVTASVARVSSPAPAEPPADAPPQSDAAPSSDGGSPATVWTLATGPARLVAGEAVPLLLWNPGALNELLDPVVPLPPVDEDTTLRIQLGAERPRALAAEESAELRPLLSPLTALRIEAIAPLSVEPYGLLDPVAALAIVPAADAGVPQTVLLLGGVAPDGARYAMLRGGYTVYALAPDTAKALLGEPFAEKNAP